MPVVEVADVFIGGGGRGASRQPPEDRGRQGQPHEGRCRPHPPGLAQQGCEDPLAHHPVEQGDAPSRQHTCDRREDQHLLRTPPQRQGVSETRRPALAHRCIIASRPILDYFAVLICLAN